jgi:adenylosuccinate synthase
MDLVALRFACMVNGVTQIIMTKADVLDSFAELKLCTAYSINGNTTSDVPFQMNKVDITPQWQSFKGWETESGNLRSLQDLPKQMEEYVQYINKFLGVNISYISNGPGRDQLIKIQ